MKYKIINVQKNIKSGGSGAFGTYYKVNSKIGVKTVYDQDFTSLKAAKQSWEIKSAEKELDNLKRVYKATKMTPKGYYVAILRMKISKHKYLYKVGYAMQHISGKVVEQSKVKDSYTLWQRAITKFSDKGYKQVDAHSCNAMIVQPRRGKPKVVFIDAGGIVPKDEHCGKCSWQ